jgi:hypothetical protein
MQEASLDDFLARSNPAVRGLVLKTRELILSAFPAALEMVDMPSNIIAYGTGRKYADLVCAIAPFASHVNLMFSRGATLPDPEGLLQGSGKRARHVKISTLADLEHPGVLTLLENAIHFESR